MELMNGTPASKAAFLRWIKTHHPRLYDDAVHGVGMGGVLDTLNDFFSKTVDFANKAGQAYINTKMQYDLVRLNIARAKQGLMPVESLAQAQPVATTTTPSAPAGATFPTWAIIALVGLGAMLLLRR